MKRMQMLHQILRWRQLLRASVSVLCCFGHVVLECSAEPLRARSLTIAIGPAQGSIAWLQSVGRALPELERALVWQRSCCCCYPPWPKPSPNVYAQLDQLDTAITDDPMIALIAYPESHSQSTLVEAAVTLPAPWLLARFLECGVDPFQCRLQDIVRFVDRARRKYGTYTVLLDHLRKKRLTCQGVTAALPDQLPRDLAALVTSYALKREPLRCLQEFRTDQKTLLDCELQKPLPGICNPGCKDVDYFYDTYATVYDLVQLGVGISQEIPRQRLRRMIRRRICSELMYCGLAAVGFGLGAYLDNGPFAATGICFALVGRFGYDLYAALKYAYVVRRSGVLNVHQA